MPEEKKATEATEAAPEAPAESPVPAEAASAPAPVAAPAPAEAAAPSPPAPPPAPAPAPGPAPFPAAAVKYGYIWGTGRRKTAVARVRIKPGEGAITVNGRPMDQYFVNIREREIATSALRATESLGRYDVFVNATGGGPVGQAYATALGTARALKLADTAFEQKLRENGLLTRDSRMKERKKYGRRGARRSFQFSKR